jgi:putative ABC transport system permease protein
VGVAADVKYLRMNEVPRSYVYVPFLQQYRPVMTLHTRGTAPDDVLVEHARAAVMKLDRDLPVLSARPMTMQFTSSLLLFNVTATMLFVFGVVGMALAALGTYGLIAYTVRQSTHEIGIRMALGADRVSVVRGFLARGLRLGVIGAALGTAGALASSRYLEGWLFGVTATDGVSFVRALAIVLAGVVMATLVPAWRASRTDPLSALRYQ